MINKKLTFPNSSNGRKYFLLYTHPRTQKLIGGHFFVQLAKLKLDTYQNGKEGRKLFKRHSKMKIK